MEEKTTTTTTAAISDKMLPESSPRSGVAKKDDNDTSAMTVSEPLVSKKKRGRPKKYSDDVTSSRSAPAQNSTETIKKSRGRPKGTTAKSSIGNFGLKHPEGGFSTHNCTVLPGEDIVRKIMSISQASTRSMCILSAVGPVSTAIIRQHSGVFFKYEGSFEIMSLAGMFVMVNECGFIRKTSKLCASLITPDGIIFGGASVASLIAADHVQLILGSFEQDKNSQSIMMQSGPFKPEELMVGPDDLIGARVVIAPNFSDDEPLTEDDDDVIYDANPISMCFPEDSTTVPINQPPAPAI